MIKASSVTSVKNDDHDSFNGEIAGILFDFMCSRKMTDLRLNSLHLGGLANLAVIQLLVIISIFFLPHERYYIVRRGPQNFTAPSGKDNSDESALIINDGLTGTPI